MSNAANLAYLITATIACIGGMVYAVLRAVRAQKKRWQTEAEQKAAQTTAQRESTNALRELTDELRSLAGQVGELQGQIRSLEGRLRAGGL